MRISQHFEPRDLIGIVIPRQSLLVRSIWKRVTLSFCTVIEAYSPTTQLFIQKNYDSFPEQYLVLSSQGLQFEVCSA